MKAADIDAAVLEALERRGDWARLGDVVDMTSALSYAEVAVALARLERAGEVERHANGGQYRVRGV